MRTWLIDTGPLVAYLDSEEAAHPAVAVRMDGFSGRLVTTSAVITEAMYFVSASESGPSLLAELVSASGIEVYDLCQPPELREAVSLMETYSDAPMDFADATLILLAEGLEAREIRCRREPGPR